MASPAAATLKPTPSGTVPVPPPPGPGSTDVLTEFADLLKKLTAKEVTTLTELINRLDAKELEAAGKYLGLERGNPRRKAKKLREVQKKKRWGRGRFSAVPDLELQAEVEQDLGDAVLPQCYEEIKQLLFIEKDPVFSKALEEWSRKELLFTSRVERKKTKVADLKNESYQLIGFFSVFQGVLLTAVSQSNLLHCNNLWSPIVLSVVASIVTIFGVAQKLYQIESLERTIHSEEQSLKVVAARLGNLRNTGVNGFEFAKFGYTENKTQSNSWLILSLSLVIASLTVFTVGFPISHWRILCFPG